MKMVRFDKEKQLDSDSQFCIIQIASILVQYEDINCEKFIYCKNRNPIPKWKRSTMLIQNIVH